MTFMTTNSRNHELAGAPYLTLSGSKVLELRDKANAHGVEWHHAAGHTKGRSIIAFFPKTEEERRAVDRLADAVAALKKEEKEERKGQKKKGLPTSKAALWRHLKAHGGEDMGFGSVEYKLGKYGPFIPSFGEADGKYFFDSEEIANIAQKKLGI